MDAGNRAENCPLDLEFLLESLPSELTSELILSPDLKRTDFGLLLSPALSVSRSPVLHPRSLCFETNNETFHLHDPEEFANLLDCDPENLKTPLSVNDHCVLTPKSVEFRDPENLQTPLSVNDHCGLTPKSVELPVPSSVRGEGEESEECANSVDTPVSDSTNCASPNFVLALSVQASVLPSIQRARRKRLRSPKKQSLSIKSRERGIRCGFKSRPSRHKRSQSSPAHAKARSSPAASSSPAAPKDSQSLPASPKDVCPPTPTRARKMWSKEEDMRLRAAVKKYGVPNWTKIAAYVKTRRNRMCAQRWQNHLQPEARIAKKGSWKKKEDDQLRKLVKKHGSQGQSWKTIAKAMKLRTTKQCRERWGKYLDPTLRHGPWTKAEDTKLLRLRRQFGDIYKPKHYVKALGGYRSAERIRRRLKTLLKK